MELSFLTEQCIGAAIDVHKTLGPGLLESSYQKCLAFELMQRRLMVQTEVLLPINYKGQRIDAGYRIDLLVASKVIIELKAVDRLSPIHTAQVITYLKLSHKRVGLLINFNEQTLKRGLKRVVL